MKLYARQAEPVLEAIRRDGVCHSRKEYVERKYAESALIFTTAYSWFVKEASKIVPLPEGAEYPYWAYADLFNADSAPGGSLLTLEVPEGQAVYFDSRDWNRVLQLSYLGENREEELEFAAELERYGTNPMQVMTSAFYPQFRQQILKSWERLFRHHEAICGGDADGVFAVQAGLWEIRREWIREGL